jgi:hypothetical protein
MPSKIAQKYRLNFTQQSGLSAPVNRALGQQFANADEMFETLFGEVRRLAAAVADIDSGSVVLVPPALQYSFSAATSAPPGTNQLRFDAPSPYTAVTKLWARTVTAGGVDAFHVLKNIAVGATLIVQDKNDHAAYVNVTVTGTPIDNTSYFEIPVSHLAHGNALSGGQPVLLQNAWQ